MWILADAFGCTTRGSGELSSHPLHNLGSGQRKHLSPGIHSLEPVLSGGQKPTKWIEREDLQSMMQARKLSQKAQLSTKASKYLACSKVVKCPPESQIFGLASIFGARLMDGMHDIGNARFGLLSAPVVPCVRAYLFFGHGCP